MGRGQITTYGSEAEAKHNIKKDIDRRKKMAAMQEAKDAERQAAAERPWEEILADLLKQEERINTQIMMGLGLLRRSAEKHIALQEEAGKLAIAHKQPNPIYAMMGGDNIKTDPERYMMYIMHRAENAIKSGAGLSKNGLEQP